jgi:hypothetical protein
MKQQYNLHYCQFIQNVFYVKDALLKHMIIMYSENLLYSNSKCVRSTFYKECCITKERFVEFLEENIFNIRVNTRNKIIIDNNKIIIMMNLK